jgi:uncharacterized membrane protein YphA (DoxX/SURF4 family)
LDRHRDRCFDLLRIYLGVGLLVKGILFFSNPQLLASMLEGRNVPAVTVMLAHYVVTAHVVGGVMMALGLLTRLAALIQLPVLVGAVFVHGQEGLFTRSQNLEFALLVLFLVVLVFLHGPGRWSLDRALLRRPSPAPAV